jgi:hypothetical protein
MQVSSMQRRLGRRTAVFAVAAVVWLAEGQAPGRARPAGPPGSQQEVQLPSGKSQRDEILKAEREQNIKDAGQLVDLAQQLQQELEKNDRFVFSIATLKKTDEIEKLVKRIRGRMRHN